MRSPLGQEWSNTQPRYVAYCLEHNASSPEDMLAFDRARHPGGCMGGFIIWVQQCWRHWAEEFGIDPDASRTEPEHDHFSDWVLEEAFSEWLLLGRDKSSRTIER